MRWGDEFKVQRYLSDALEGIVRKAFILDDGALYPYLLNHPPGPSWSRSFHWLAVGLTPRRMEFRRFWIE